MEVCEVDSLGIAVEEEVVEDLGDGLERQEKEDAHADYGVVAIELESISTDTGTYCASSAEGTGGDTHDIIVLSLPNPQPGRRKKDCVREHLHSCMDYIPSR